MRFTTVLFSLFLLVNPTKKFDKIGHKNECSIFLNIDEEGNVYYHQKIISSKGLNTLLIQKLKSCKSKFELKVSSPMPYNYLDNYRKVEKTILKSIEFVQNKYSMKKYEKPLDSLTMRQFQNVQKIYPSEFSTDFCCKEE